MNRPMRSALLDERYGPYELLAAERIPAGVKDVPQATPDATHGEWRLCTCGYLTVRYDTCGRHK
jgi:hypothetical protein